MKTLQDQFDLLKKKDHSGNVPNKSTDLMIISCLCNIKTQFTCIEFKYSLV